MGIAARPTEHGATLTGSSGTQAAGEGTTNGWRRCAGVPPRSAAHCVRLASTGSAHLTRRPSLPAILKYTPAVAHFTWRGNPADDIHAGLPIDTMDCRNRDV